MMKATDGRNVPATLSQIHNHLLSDALRIRDLGYALACVLARLSDEGAVCGLQAMSSAESLIEEVQRAHDGHLTNLEVLERHAQALSRLSAQGGVS